MWLPPPPAACGGPRRSGGCRCGRWRRGRALGDGTEAGARSRRDSRRWSSSGCGRARGSSPGPCPGWSRAKKLGPPGPCPDARGRTRRPRPRFPPTPGRDAAARRARSRSGWRHRYPAMRRFQTHRTWLDQVSFPSLTYVGDRDPELTLELDDIAPGEADQRDLHAMAPRQRLHLRHRARRHADDEAARGFSEERRIRPDWSFGLQRRAPDAEAAQHAALRQRDEHPAVGAIVARSQQAGASSLEHELVGRSLARQVQRRWPAGDEAVLDFEVLAATEVVVAGADQQDEVPFVAQSRLKSSTVILKQADHPDHRRRVNRRLTRGVVVEADVAADNRELETTTRQGQACDGLLELPIDLGPVRVREVQAVCDRQRARAGGAEVWIEVTVAAVAVGRHRNAQPRAFDSQHRGVA